MLLIIINPENALITIMCVSLGTFLPDLDNPRSLVSGPFFNLSQYINYKFGHRTICHSPAWLLGFLIGDLAGIDILMYVSLGALLHISLDMFTPSGIKLFPSSARAFWNRALIIKDEDSENKIFWVCVIVVLVEVILFVLLHS